jgi:hypothetical protein
MRCVRLDRTPENLQCGLGACGIGISHPTNEKSVLTESISLKGSNYSVVFAWLYV